MRRPAVRFGELSVSVYRLMYWALLLLTLLLHIDLRSTLFVKAIKHVRRWFHPGNRTPTFPACLSSVGFIWGVNSPTAVLTSLPSVSQSPNLLLSFLPIQVGRRTVNLAVFSCITACFIKEVVLWILHAYSIYTIFYLQLLFFVTHFKTPRDQDIRSL